MGQYHLNSFLCLFQLDPSIFQLYKLCCFCYPGQGLSSVREKAGVALRIRSTSSCEEAVEVEEHPEEEEEDDDSVVQPISPTNKGVFSSITSAVQNTVSAHLHLSIHLSIILSVPFTHLV